MALASINPTYPRTDLWNFREKILRIGDFEKQPFWKIGHFEFFSSKKNFFFLLDSYENQSKFVWYNGWVKILMFSLVSRKFLAMRNITLCSVPNYDPQKLDQLWSSYCPLKCLKWTYLQANQESYQQEMDSHCSHLMLFNLLDFGKETRYGIYN